MDIYECGRCHKLNRREAFYCRYCGEPLEAAANKTADTPASVAAAPVTPPRKPREYRDILDELVCLDEAKEQVRELVATVRALVKQRGRGVLKSLNTNILITGPAGSGVSAFHFVVGDFMCAQGIYDNDKSDTFDPITIDQFKPSEKPLEGILIDDADKMLPDDVNESLLGSPLDYVFTLARAIRREKEEQFGLIVAGGPKLQEYVDAHPDLKGLFTLNIKLRDYTPAEVTDICEAILEKTYSTRLSDEARAKLTRVFNHERRTAEKFGNAHLAALKADELIMAATRRMKGKAVTVVEAEDVTGEEYVPKTLDDVMKEFDKYVGVDEIKKTMSDIVDSITSFKRLHPDKPYELKDHFFFLGNPGTGKTTIARVFADALSAMGILPSGQLVEVAPKDLKGQYMGHTGPKVDAAFDRAMGGVLFIDEAYDMWGGPDDMYGNEAVTALIKNVEDRRGKLVVILAGYPREMDLFTTANPGIRSRFNMVVNFRNYTGPELTEIARRMVKAQGYTVAPEAEKALEQFFARMSAKAGKDFANARDVRNAVDKAVRAQNARIRKERAKPGFNPAREFELSLADFTGTDERPPMSVDEVIASMDDLIGMADIKQEIRKLANVAMVNRMRMERGLGSATLQPVNIILTGNPGTGKTTIAKRLGQVLHAAGVLSTDKVVEREAKTILSSYINESGKNMDKAVDEAMGGVLFIDEAYNLLPVPGSNNNTGNEALDALMTRMENDKGKFVVVIAGYKDRMEQLIERGNPGLMSRFNKHFHIADYDADALMEIFRLNVVKRGFLLTVAAEAAARRRIADMVASKGRHFGNAREVVNLLNEVVELQGNRIASDTSIIDSNPDALTTIEEVDIPVTNYE